MTFPPTRRKGPLRRGGEADPSTGSMRTAQELTGALIVNPLDLTGMAEALNLALNMSLAERKSRYGDMMATLRANSVSVWRDRFMRDLRG